MNKNTWIAAAALGLIVGLPSVAHAHGQYLQQVNDTVAADVADPACELPGMTCGLCHQPLEGDRLENIVVGFPEIDTFDRNGPFYDSLMAAGWAHAPHGGGMGHVDDNRMLLADTALPAMLAMDIDSDNDGVGDLEELSLGYNPLLEYEEADPMRSQICPGAGEFPMGGGEESSSGGAEDSTGGGGASTGDEAGSTGGGAGSTGGGGGSTGSPGSDTNGTGPDPETGGSGGSGGTGDSGGGDDGGGGCRIAGSGYDAKILGALLMLGLVARRRW